MPHIAADGLHVGLPLEVVPSRRIVELWQQLPAFRAVPSRDAVRATAKGPPVGEAGGNLRARTRKVAWKTSSAACGVAEHAPADVQDHRPMQRTRAANAASDRFIPGHEPSQQLPVAQAGERPHVPEGLDRFQRGSDTPEQAMKRGSPSWSFLQESAAFGRYT